MTGRQRAAIALLLTMFVAASCSSGGGGGSATPTTELRLEGTIELDAEPIEGCEVLQVRHCYLPFPSDAFTVASCIWSASSQYSKPSCMVISSGLSASRS